MAAQLAASAPADGYTLYMPTSTALVILPEINTKIALDFERDFAPIGLVGETPMAIAASAASQIGSLPELIRPQKRSPESCSMQRTVAAPHLIWPASTCGHRPALT